MEIGDGRFTQNRDYGLPRFLLMGPRRHPVPLGDVDDHWSGISGLAAEAVVPAIGAGFPATHVLLQIPVHFVGVVSVEVVVDDVPDFITFEGPLETRPIVRELHRLSFVEITWRPRPARIGRAFYTGSHFY